MALFGIDLETLRLLLQEASLVGVGVGFLVGLVFSFNPVSLASIPVVLAYVTGGPTRHRAGVLIGAFIGGMLVAHAFLGVAAALGGEWIESVMGHQWDLLLGPVLVVLGLMWAGWLEIRMPWIGLRGRQVAGVWGAFLLGIPFTVIACPFCAPALLISLTDKETDLETLRLLLQEASLVGVGVGFLVGLVFSFNPVSLASIPVVLAYVTGGPTRHRAGVLIGAFIGGMLVAHAFLGVAAALGGEWIESVMGHQWDLLLGPVLVVLGLMWAGWLEIRMPWIGLRGRQVAGVWGAFLLGIPFTVIACPFCAPALLISLTGSAAIGSAPFGFALLLAFGVGRSVPILLSAMGIGWLKSLNRLQPAQNALAMVAGITLTLTGFYLIGDYLINHH